MRILLTITVLLLLIGCSNNENRRLLEDTIDIIKSGSNFKHFEIIDECHCIITAKDGESVDTIVKKVDFGELDYTHSLVVDSTHTYISYFVFDNGAGIDIIYLSPLPNQPITPEMYKSVIPGIGYSSNTEAQLNLVISNLRQVAKNCGATLRDSL